MLRALLFHERAVVRIHRVRPHALARRCVVKECAAARAVSDCCPGRRQRREQRLLGEAEQERLTVWVDAKKDGVLQHREFVEQIFVLRSHALLRLTAKLLFRRPLVALAPHDLSPLGRPHRRRDDALLRERAAVLGRSQLRRFAAKP